ncbi:MAG TPA: DNA methyltransferase, partial [Pirellulales bacterium]
MEYEQPDFDGVPVDRTTVAQALLNIDNKRRSNPLPWNGQFSPELVEALLRAYAPRNGLVLDPFSGSGTVLCEAGRRGLPAIGAEINPAAFKMSQIYCLINASVAERKRMTDAVDWALHQNLTHEELPLFTENGNDGPSDMKAFLVE